MLCCCAKILLTILLLKFQTNKQEQQTAFNQYLDIVFKDFMNLYKKCTAKPYPFLVTDASPASDNPSRFRKNFLERT